jgi:hypothetical protein
MAPGDPAIVGAFTQRRDASRWGSSVNPPRYALLALCIVPLCAPVGALAQQDDSKWGKPIDLKPLIIPLPPVVPLPRDFQLNTGTAGTSQTYSAPMQNPNLPAKQSGPGIKFSIPTR